MLPSSIFNLIMNFDADFADKKYYAKLPSFFEYHYATQFDFTYVFHFFLDDASSLKNVSLTDIHDEKIEDIYNFRAGPTGNDTFFT